MTTVFFVVGLIFKKTVAEQVQKVSKSIERREKVTFIYPKSDAQAEVDEMIRDNDLKGKDTKIDF